MKLNLLPTHVSKEGQTMVAVIVTSVVSLAAIIAGIFAVGFSSTALATAKERDSAAKPAYDKAMETSVKADEIMASSVIIDRNDKLAKAMIAHNTVYPALYKEVLSHCPSFFRVVSITAVPAGPASCTVTMQGVIQSYQQYADIMLAMLRIKGATNVTRAGFADGRPVVPPLNEQDQIGTAVLPGQAGLPSDPRDRLEEMVARASQAPTGFLGTTFGQPVDQKGAMPDWSLITVAVTISQNIQTPNPRATLTSQIGGTTAPAAGGGGFAAPGPVGKGGGR